MYRTAHGDKTLIQAAETLFMDPSTSAMYRRAWDDLQVFHRDSEMLAAIAIAIAIAIARALGLTSGQINALFLLAAGIKA